MNLSSWLDGVATVAFTLIPPFLIWACAVLWVRSRSNWALTALIASSLAVAGVLAIWVDFYIHYSSVEVMRAQNADPNLALQRAVKLTLSLGLFMASLALVGYARSLPTAAQPGAPGDGVGDPK